ncbi:MAG: tetratricopeptide repeat protein, partial [Planctomycetota bacterium]
MKKGEQLILGELALSKGFIKKQHLEEATTKTKMEGNLIAYLVESNRLSKKNLSSILEYHKTVKEQKKQDKTFARYLLDNHIVDRHKLKQCFRKQEDLEKQGRYASLSKIIVQEHQVPKTQICNFKEGPPPIRLRKSLKRICNLAKIYFNLGNNFFQAQDWNGAKKAYQKSLQEDPDFLPALLNRGVTSLILQEYDQALADFNAALALDPSNILGYSNKGLLLLLKNNPQEAYSELTKALKLNKKLAPTWNNRAICLTLLKKWKKAEVDMEKASKLDSDCP